MSDTSASVLEAGSRISLDLLSCVLVGELLLAAWLLPSLPDGTLAPRSRAVLRRAPLVAALWALSALVLAAASTVQLARVPVTSLLEPRTLAVAWQLPQVRALAVLVGTALALVAVLPRLRRVLPARAAMLIVVVALGLLTTTGHSGAAASHFWAAESVLVHVGAVTVWVGGLLSLAVRARDPALLRVVLVPYSRVALVAFLLVALTGVLGAAVRLGPPGPAWASAYGGLVVVKAGLLVLVGGVGALHRRWTIPRALAGRPRLLLRLAAAELAVLAGASVVAVLLARTPTPVGALTLVAPAHSEQFPTIDRMIEAPGWRLLTEGRGDPVLVAVVVTLAASYLAAVRAHERRGGSWPRGRTVCFVTGSLLALWCLAGGPAAYAAGDLGIYTARLVGLTVLVPLLLALGGPLTLVASSGGRSERGRWARVLLNPVNAVTVLVVLVSLLFNTPLLELSFRHPALHAGLSVVLLVLGTICATSAWGPDAARGTPIDVRTPLLLWALTWFVLAVHLFAGGRLVAADWFVDLGLYWGDPPSAQLRASVVLAVGAGLVAAGAFRTAGRAPGVTGTPDARADLPVRRPEAGSRSRRG